MELVQGAPITEFCDKNQLSAKERLELLNPVRLKAVEANDMPVTLFVEGIAAVSLNVFRLSGNSRV